MPKQKWFDRKFDFVLQPEIYPLLVERLRGTPARIEERIKGLPEDQLTATAENQWSIQENIGHLVDLESLWAGRVQDFKNRLPKLRPADLQNTATYQAKHNEKQIFDILHAFRQERGKLIAELDQFDEEDAALVALHPRLLQPMRLLDLLYFVAEHDDHHLACITELLRN
ncbi:MAG: DinB family protein [Calditrichaeota bacterium]|nr:MAG: DinB family protein [Calditrichota bacterium]